MQSQNQTPSHLNPSQELYLRCKLLPGVNADVSDYLWSNYTRAILKPDINRTCVILNHFQISAHFQEPYRHTRWAAHSLCRSVTCNCLLTINGSNNCHWNNWNKSHSSSLITFKMSVTVCGEGQRLDMPFGPADTEQLWAACFNLVTHVGPLDSWDILGISQSHHFCKQKRNDET